MRALAAFAFTAAALATSSALLTSPAQAQTATLAYTASPAADKVYPPLPSLAMLPPATGDEDTLPAPRNGARKKKVKAHLDCRCSAPAPRLVVSDASRAYLKDIEKQIDVALAH